MENQSKSFSQEKNIQSSSVHVLIEEQSHSVVKSYNIPKHVYEEVPRNIEIISISDMDQQRFIVSRSNISQAQKIAILTGMTAPYYEPCVKRMIEGSLPFPNCAGCLRTLRGCLMLKCTRCQTFYHASCIEELDIDLFPITIPALDGSGFINQCYCYGDKLNIQLCSIGVQDRYELACKMFPQYPFQLQVPEQNVEATTAQMNQFTHFTGRSYSPFALSGLQVIKKTGLKTFHLQCRNDRILTSYGSSVEFPVRIAESQFGLGLFATKPIPNHGPIADYDGQVSTFADIVINYSENQYILKLIPAKDPFNDISITPISWGSFGIYANHSSARQNAEMVFFWTSKGLMAFLIATRRIEAGEEIRWSYGKDYIPARNWE